jgi:hypothetical protein
MRITVFFRFGAQVKIVHFLGTVKPWHHSYGAGGLVHQKGNTHQIDHLSCWWRIFNEDVQTTLKPEYVSMLHVLCCRLCPLTAACTFCSVYFAPFRASLDVNSSS